MATRGSRRRFWGFLRPSAVLNNTSSPSTSIHTIVTCGRPLAPSVTTCPYALSSSNRFADSGSLIAMMSSSCLKGYSSIEVEASAISPSRCMFSTRAGRLPPTSQLRKERSMTTLPGKDDLLVTLDQVVQDTLAYFDGAGRTTKARVDQWQARDVLMHFVYFHDATAWGIESAARGGPPWLVPADADTVNDVCRRLHERESIDDLLVQLRLAHARLLAAARKAPDLDQPCFKRSSGEVMTGRQRLELLARHWAEHVHELQAAAGAR